jgi:hypothetical protein
MFHRPDSMACEVKFTHSWDGVREVPCHAGYRQCGRPATPPDSAAPARGGPTRPPGAIRPAGCAGVGRAPLSDNPGLIALYLGKADADSRQLLRQLSTQVGCSTRHLPSPIADVPQWPPPAAMRPSLPFPGQTGIPKSGHLFRCATNRELVPMPWLSFLAASPFLDCRRNARCGGSSSDVCRGVVSGNWHRRAKRRGGGLWLRRRQELKDGTPRFVRFRPQSSPVSFDDRAADR